MEVSDEGGGRREESDAEPIREDAQNARIGNMIAAHHDEIWNIGSTDISGGGQFQYHTAYRVGFGNMEEVEPAGRRGRWTGDDRVE